MSPLADGMQHRTYRGSKSWKLRDRYQQSRRKKLVTMQTHGSAVWHGGIKDGQEAITTKSGALDHYPYGFASRFEGKPGTNPEELIGAAHAGCFTMGGTPAWCKRASAYEKTISIIH